MTTSQHVDVAVVGGGIAGLSTAWLLTQQRPGIRVTVFDAAETVGGKLRQEKVAGHWVDVGAESVLARRPEAMALARDVGLGDEIIEPLTMTAGVRADGVTHPMPQRTLFGIPSDIDAVADSGVLSTQALARLRQELEMPPMAALEQDVTVGSLVRERLGDEVVDKLVEPLLGGVYAGSCDNISLAAAMPTLYAQLREGGGSLLGAVAQLMQPRTGASLSSPSFPFVSLRGGVATLPAALADSGRFEVRTKTVVTALEKVATGDGHKFVLRYGGGEHAGQLSADRVVIATPPSKSAALLHAVAPAAAALLKQVTTASMAIVTFAFDRSDIEQANFPAGSGQLVAASEGLVTKALTYTSQKWPGAPADLFFLRGSVGKAGEVAPLQWDDADLLQFVRADLARLTGLSAQPVEAIITRWGGGLPQYAAGHVELVRGIRDAVALVEGLAVCGATYDGVGIAACIGSAQAAVTRLFGADS